MSVGITFVCNITTLSVASPCTPHFFNDANPDLQNWHVTSKINSVYPLAMVNMSAKFDADAHNGFVVITLLDRANVLLSLFAHILWLKTHFFQTFLGSLRSPTLINHYFPNFANLDFQNNFFHISFFNCLTIYTYRYL